MAFHETSLLPLFMLTRLLAKYLFLLDNVVVECTVEQLTDSEAGEGHRMMSTKILYF